MESRYHGHNELQVCIGTVFIMVFSLEISCTGKSFFAFSQSFLNTGKCETELIKKKQKDKYNLKVEV